MTARTEPPGSAGGGHPATPGDGDEGGRAAGVAEGKDVWRRRVLAARRALAPEERAARAAALAEGAVALAAGCTGPVCAYLPVGREPGSVAGLDALRAAGHEVLLPVVPDRAGPLDWARYDGPDWLADGPLGLREPTGPRLGVTTITRAGLVLVPALAADRRGVRLGRGGGYYDRTLPLAGPGTQLVVLLNDDELVAELPAEPHDVRVTAALLPRAGVVMLGDTI
ncbi:5-formyltetrahydrofolate cyclo-ligase [Pseudonocardia bannensis]|uniref:5-formyltetrahydrofolate cyclo-ligase n=1 Tax=Pseudonocardia bannensis TaxID=630973 RepID=A0A848DD21_9PSEU|nr:5-formyltetrahydrofolate cyclo-ligase [Pseudonocardia bannensis]NMH90518.1 5-formyltetrahydrofolate cyclo-ligase [Pseudonocardia bannensis]